MKWPEILYQPESTLSFRDEAMQTIEVDYDDLKNLSVTEVSVQSFLQIFFRIGHMLRNRRS